MFGKAVPLLRISGIPIRIDPSWVLIAALILWSLGTQYFPLLLPRSGGATILVLSVLGALGLFVSLTLHELAHSLVARRLGLRINGITLFLFGGVAELGSEPRRPRDEFWIAVAGPAASLALALLFEVLGALGGNREFAAMVGYLAWVNWALAIFNLIPAYPMDGGRVLRAALWARSGDMNRATMQAAMTGTVFGLGLIGLGLYSVARGAGFGGFWMMLIGYFVFSSARANHAHARQHADLGGLKVSQLMTADPVCVAPDLDIDTLVHDVMLPRKISFVPVCDGATVLGHVDSNRLRDLPRAAWPQTRVGDILRTCTPETVLAPDMRAQDVLDRMLESGERKFLVMAGARLAGVLSASDLLSYLALRKELGDRGP